MKFNDTSEYSGIINDIDFLLFGDGETSNSAYTLKDRTRNVNIAYDEVVDLLFKNDPNWQWDDTTYTNVPIATTTLVSGQSNYTFPDSLVVIRRVRVTDSNGDLKTLDPITRREADDDDLDESGEPDSYYKIGNAVFLVPVPDYGGTIEVQFQRGANYFTSSDTSREPGFAEQFHSFLSISAALRFAVANGMAQKAEALRYEKEVMKRAIREHYELRSRDQKPHLSLPTKPIKYYGL